MPRDRMDDARGGGDRRDRRDESRGGAGPAARDDFGQADFSKDYVYDPDRRTAHRAADDAGRRADDYGQADYSDDYGYDPRRGHGYRRFSEDDRDHGGEPAAERDYGRRMDTGDYRRGEPPGPGERGRSWMDRAGAFFGGREEPDGPRRRRGPSDRVLWAVIVERLEDERALDLRDVEVLVENAEVTLNGTVRRKEDKRRIEDIADLDGVRHVQNNLRVRDAGRHWF
ncbi:MAG: hypothetical protein JWQ97_2530 [Phenylobacterium sp.]|nr:hypothetical protein [Phenylobacterium sp.]